MNGYKLDDQTIIRLPLDLAREVRSKMNAEDHMSVNSADDDNGAQSFQIQALTDAQIECIIEEIDRNYHLMQLKGHMFYYLYDLHYYPALLWNLPCVVESHKTMDRKQLYKAGDVGQILIVHDKNVKWESILPRAFSSPTTITSRDQNSGVDTKSDKHQVKSSTKVKSDSNSIFSRQSGITPPTTHIVENRFKKTAWHVKHEGKEVESVEMDMKNTIDRISESKTGSTMTMKELVEMPSSMSQWEMPDVISFNEENWDRKVEKFNQEARELDIQAVTSASGTDPMSLSPLPSDGLRDNSPSLMLSHQSKLNDIGLDDDRDIDQLISEIDLFQNEDDFDDIDNLLDNTDNFNLLDPPPSISPVLSEVNSVIESNNTTTNTTGFDNNTI